MLPQELYVSYNDISDLSPLCLLEQLEVLDLEGNCVEDLGQVRCLQLCPRLTTLTLEGNLVCLQPAPGHSNKVCMLGGAHRSRASVPTTSPGLLDHELHPSVTGGLSAARAHPEPSHQTPHDHTCRCHATQPMPTAHGVHIQATRSHPEVRTHIHTRSLRPHPDFCAPQAPTPQEDMHSHDGPVHALRGTAT